mgnify:CR=1 FL=1
MLPVAGGVDFDRLPVSILTGPGGPVLPVRPSASILQGVFQSSPGPKARCYGRRLRGRRLVVDVSILTGPEGPVLHVSRCAC